MKTLLILCLISVNTFFSFTQKNNTKLSGSIGNYSGQPLFLYQCFKDTVLLSDSTYTNEKGEFTLNFDKLSRKKTSEYKGLYKIQLSHNQFFYIINVEKPVEIKTVFLRSQFNNISSDSLTVIRSEENKLFYQFQRIQQKINIADYFLLKMMRHYPLTDPFHVKMEKEYYARHDSLNAFVEKINKGKSTFTSLITKAYYQPVLPDWKQPDYWRDSIFAAHYFDYFNPAEEGYLYTNVLPEKMDNYLELRNNQVDMYGRKVIDEMLSGKAAVEFVEKTINSGIEKSSENFQFCLNYLLKKLEREHMDLAFLHLYNRFGKPELGYCEATNDNLDWARKKATLLKGLQIGSNAPGFEILVDSDINKEKEIKGTTIALQQIQAKYTLVIFWATWCSHCVQEVPEISKEIERFNKKSDQNEIETIAISLDKDPEELKKFIEKENLLNFINYSEYSGWDGKIANKYNVYATPTMFLLDENKKIIAKPNSYKEFERILKEQVR